MNKMLLTLLLVPQIALGNALPKQLAVPGGIVNIELGSVATPAPEVLFQDKRVLVMENDHTWVAVVGIPLKSKAGQHSIQVKSAEKPPSLISTSLIKSIQRNISLSRTSAWLIQTLMM